MSSGFTITSETQAYKRYLTVFDRQITYPDGRTAAFDIVGHPRSSFQFAVVFVYWSERKRVTLLREFAQAAAGLVYNFPTGSYDAGKDTSLQQSAARELSEEAGLTGGTWHRLLDDDHPGILEGKWCSNRFTPFLVIDPVQAEPQVAARDAEEHIEVIEWTIEELRAAILRGELLTPSVQTAFSALAWLEREKLL